MHYYTFHIGDYMSHTAHLSDIEDLIYRRLIDICYLHEKPLPKCEKMVAKMIRMEGHLDLVKNVIQNFFVLKKNGWENKRIFQDILSKKEISEKRREAVNKRWQNKSLKNKEKSKCQEGNTNVIQKKYNCNTNVLQKNYNCNTNVIHPLPNNQYPIEKNKKNILSNDKISKKFSLDFSKIPSTISKARAQAFVDHRINKKKPLTQRAFESQMRAAYRIGEGDILEFSADQAIQATISAGWLSINQEYLFKRFKGKKTYEKQQVNIDSIDW